MLSLNLGDGVTENIFVVIFLYSEFISVNKREHKPEPVPPFIELIISNP
jgi:hypothetical protein